MKTLLISSLAAILFALPLRAGAAEATATAPAAATKPAAAERPERDVPPGEIDAASLAKRVGQVFAGYDDFWVWINQRFIDQNGNETKMLGRAYFKRDKMFRINFGQPPVRVEGTDGKEYWIYDVNNKTVKHTTLNQDAPVHVLFQVFAAGNQMVKALDRFFNVSPLKETTYGANNLPAYKLVLTLKPERLKELREQEGASALVDPNAKQVWTFIIDKKDSLPKEIRVDWENGEKYIFELGKFQGNIPLDARLFNRPTPEGAALEEIKKP